MHHDPPGPGALQRPDVLVVGLGNPGREYAKSRHNAGAMAVEILARQHRIALEKRGKTRVGEGSIAGKQVLVALPQTFMNSSGEAVGPLVGRTGVSISNLLVVYDDMDLPLGVIRLRPYGSSGGHNGMKSIIAHLGHNDRFPRLRIGIGRPEQAGRDTISYVLDTFAPEERSELDDALGRAVQAIETICAEGLERAMNRFN